MKLRLTSICLIACCLLAIRASADPREIFRIRVENTTGGRIQVSIDEGKAYHTVGYVRRHAVAYYTGFGASAYVPVGTVAATAVHGLRLKIGNVTTGKTTKPMVVSVIPKEFDETPELFGGHVSYGSGIYTDIASGHSIFRNFAPFAGNPVKLERSGALAEIPEGWSPADGDIIVITAMLPDPYLRSIEFENRLGGAVTATYANGTSDRVATVQRTVRGVGRFDGTSYTGVGLLNTNHGGVITVSTAPISKSKLQEGTGEERRGGFQIDPSVHAAGLPTLPQVMTVKPIPGQSPLEGRPPLFRDYIGLAFDPNDPANTARVEVAGSGGKWQPMPQLVGKSDNALAAREVIRLRIVFPRYDREFLARWYETERRMENVVRGTAALRPDKQPPAGCIATFGIDGTVRGIVNQPPYEYQWDTTATSNGDHEIEIRVVDGFGNEVSKEKRKVEVENP